MGTPNWLKFKRRDVATTVAFVLAGVCIRLMLLNYNVPNFEPVMALTIIASMVIPLVLAAVVPIGIMAVTDTLIYAFDIRGSYGMMTVVGITFFVWTGFLMATLVGWRLRKRYAFKIGNLGIVTGAGLVATLVFDLWTDAGLILTIGKPIIDTLRDQVFFTLIHLASTLIFIPLLGSGYILLSDHKTEFSAQAPRDCHEGEARPGV